MGAPIVIDALRDKAAHLGRRYRRWWKRPNHAPRIFLDVDGVLNAHRFDWTAMSNAIDRDKVLLLNLVMTATGSRIILSSAWRYIAHRGEMNLAGLEWLFRSHGLMAGSIAGVTRADRMMPRTYDGDRKPWPLEDERGLQVAEWREANHHVGRYVVIDDGGTRPDGTWTDLGIGVAGHPFVRTDGSTGLTEADAAKAIRILRPERIETDFIPGWMRDMDPEDLAEFERLSDLAGM